MTRDVALAALAVLPQDLPLDLRLTRIFRIEDAAWRQARRLGADYLMARAQRSQELALWQANYDYWRRLVEAYEDCVWRHQANGAESPANSWLDLLYSRLLHAYGFCHKWARFRYGPIAPELWSGAGRAYLGAVAADVAERESILYPGPPVVTSPRREYLKILLMQSSALENLLPLEIEVAQQLIAYLVPTAHLSEDPRHGNVHWVDAISGNPPRRLMRMPESSPGRLFFSAGKTLLAIAELRQRIIATGEVPGELRRGGQLSGQLSATLTAPGVVRLLDHLAAQWNPTPLSRQLPREPAKCRIDVVQGLDQVFAALQESGGGKVESWIADNISRDGIGAVVALEANEGLRIGLLLALQTEGSNTWQLGVIRRIVRESATQAQVGVSLLGHSARFITLDASSGVTVPAVAIDDLVPGEKTRLAMPRTEFQIGPELSLKEERTTLALQPEALLTSGGDYAIGRFAVEVGA